MTQSANFVGGVRKRTYNFLKIKDSLEENKYFATKVPKTKPGIDPSQEENVDYKEKLLHFVKNESNYRPNSRLPTIGSVASFDDILEIVTEFYQE